MASDPKNIEVAGAKFELLLSSEEIQKRIDEIAAQLREQMEGRSKVTFICILKGALMFTADLVREFGGSCTLEFMRCRSYHGLTSNRSPQIDYSSLELLMGHHVVIVEDIVETGYTLDMIQSYVATKRPATMTTVSLLRKPDCHEKSVFVDHVGFDIGEEYVVGYGMDFEGEGRNLRAIYRTPEGR